MRTKKRYSETGTVSERSRPGSPRKEIRKNLTSLILSIFSIGVLEKKNTFFIFPTIYTHLYKI
ncbi:hypothetical protein BpHYR1_036961 [Brachionus plicatilis]|uniref:Uncharacterized protein n=1 Tax=Brachionus plicatilis TaxID=10195 RepID=A0A3M7S929_BRAPC|nr:hypothetical protein BpHYR1_036961 [Brachionus plicatilis]